MANPVGAAPVTWRHRCANLVLAAVFIGGCGAASIPARATAPPLTIDAPTDPPPTTTTAPTTPVMPITAPTEPAEASPATAPFAAASGFSGERARQDVDQLALTIGSRVAGSPAQAQATDHLAGQFAAAGFQVDRQPFSFTSYEDRGSILNVQTPEPQPIRVATLTNSPAGQVRGAIVSVGLARPGDFDPASLIGRIALARRGEIRFSDKLANVAAAGATALLIYNDQPGGFNGSLVGVGQIPTAGVSGEDGEQLMTLLERASVDAELTVDASLPERQATNVVATKPGGEREVVVGAHFDSVSAGPGANDNGSGAAVLLELARVTTARTYPFTLRLIAFDAEELGLHGSKHYVHQRTPADLSAHLAMINLDMVGVGERMLFAGDDVLVARALEHADEAGQVGGLLNEGPSSSSDHASFQAAGVRTIFVHRARDPRYHTADDRAEYVLPNNLAAAGTVVLGLLDDLAEEVRRAGP
jgi:aminopeptidase YwaD